MSELEVIENKKIENMIYEIRKVKAEISVIKYNDNHYNRLVIPILMCKYCKFVRKVKI